MDQEYFINISTWWRSESTVFG